MSIRPTIDSETRLELLIKLAFQIPVETLAKEYNITKNKIINLRKNNYRLYNTFFDHWRIDKEVAVLGLAPKLERALSILKKHYGPHKVKIVSDQEFYICGEKVKTTELFDWVDVVLSKDDIVGFRDMTNVKNYY